VEVPGRDGGPPFARGAAPVSDRPALGKDGAMTAAPRPATSPPVTLAAPGIGDATGWALRALSPAGADICERDPWAHRPMGTQD
jgi:hypothetical protein